MSDDWKVFLIFGGVLIVALVLSGWLFWIASMAEDSLNPMDWSPGLFIPAYVAIVGVIVSTVLTGVAYVVLLASGEITKLSLIVPLTVIGYTVRRVTLWAMRQHSSV